MLLFVGLGNPGQKYENNRHNIGFMAVDDIAHRHNFSPWRSRFQGKTSEGRIGSEKVLALKPETYMNESGRAVGEAIRFFKIDPEDVFVFYDELDLAPGKLRIKKSGGSGGHNGIKSIDAHIGKEYWRLRMGIGHPGHKERVTGHVLGDFSKADQDWLGKEINAISQHIDLLVKGDSPGFMSKVAQDVAPPKPKKVPATKASSNAPESGKDTYKTVKAEAIKTDASVKNSKDGWQSTLANWFSNSKTPQD
ncbi:aminoacyl-tRNA hydrolase [Kiloniella sp. EL199]|uniref:aminoacyl-tRNA hydrolase n=1 Tax=Kiloniella sp. EL199 TaxID=2107581 RepID=UPI000EA19644|nr:aminoacyl-tRNA hydrolase [Kiloniella sp. EL199]